MRLKNTAGTNYLEFHLAPCLNKNKVAKITIMEPGFDSGYESNGENYELNDIIAGDHDDVPLDLLLRNIN